jgi:hypothetical protein
MLIKRLAMGAAAIMLTLVLAGPAPAISIDDALIGTSANLHDASPATEQAWLETLLGGTKVTLVQGGAWDYVVVKNATDWAAYSDTVNDNVLTVNGQSVINGHIRYFQVSGGPYQTVPEPSALLLLVAGLLAVTPFGWALRRRG